MTWTGLIKGKADGLNHYQSKIFLNYYQNLQVLSAQKKTYYDRCMYRPYMYIYVMNSPIATSNGNDLQYCTSAVTKFTLF